MYFTVEDINGWQRTFFVFRFMLEALVQILNKRHDGIHFTSLSVAGIINNNIRCHRLKPVNKRFAPSAIYAFDCRLGSSLCIELNVEYLCDQHSKNTL